MKVKKILNNPFKTRVKYWASKECRDRAMQIPLLSANQKLVKTATGSLAVAGLELMPMWKGSCPYHTTCSSTCLEGSGVAQCIHQHSGLITSVDKCRLSRHWLLKKHATLFNMRLSIELEAHAHQANLNGQQLVARLDAMSEIKLRDEYAPRYENIEFYDYFKEKARILHVCPSNMKEIYSWNEDSEILQVSQCEREGKAMSVVLPRKVHKDLFAAFDKDDRLKVLEHGDVIIVDGDASDLHAIDHAQPGVLTISALKEKVTRYGQKKTAFINSWSSLWGHLGL